jgi:hypothetical protein
VADCGALYIVVGDGYEEAAVRSAQSLQRVMPDIPIAVATDGRIGGPFNHHVPLSETDGYRAKIVGARQTPFERTLILDVDTYVLADISDVFDLLDNFHMALAHAPGRMSLAFDDVPAAFPEFNTGVIAYRRNEVTTSVLDDWLREYDRLAFSGGAQDQPSFRRVVYRESALRIATLAPEYNQRFWMAGFFVPPIRILHGWARESDYRRVAAAMNEPSEGDCAVFAGGRVYNSHGKKVDDFRSRWRHVRTLMRWASDQVRRFTPHR